MNVFKFLTNWRYRYWYKKIKGMKKMIEDEKFTAYKTSELREEVRGEYDQEQARLDNLDRRIKNKKDTIAEIGEGEFKRLEDEKIITEAKSKGLQEEMDTLTMKVKGGKPTQEHPAGVIGSEQTIEKLHDLIDFVKHYIKDI